MSDDTVEFGYCVFSGARTKFRLPNGDFVCEYLVHEYQQKSWLDECLEYTDVFFRDHPGLRKMIDKDGHVYVE